MRGDIHLNDKIRLRDKAPGSGYYCEDCDRIMDSASYGDHNADHSCRPIVWEFLSRKGAKP